MRSKNAKFFDDIPLELPLRKILSRLGFNFTNTVVDKPEMDKILSLIKDAFFTCKISGGYRSLRIINKTRDSILFENDHLIKSAGITGLLKDSNEVLFLFATAGVEIVNHRDNLIKNDDLKTAVIYDAVGSEAADGGLSWIHKHISNQLIKETGIVTERRFSPGYGDLTMDTQKFIYELLEMNRYHIVLSENYIFSPEKTVSAIAGITI